MEISDKGNLDLPSGEYFSVSFLISICCGYGTKRGEESLRNKLLYIFVWLCMIVCKRVFICVSL